MTIIIIIIDRFYIVLVSAIVEQTHCARMWFYMSEYLFIAVNLNEPTALDIFKPWGNNCKFQPVLGYVDWVEDLRRWRSW